MLLVKAAFLVLDLVDLVILSLENLSPFLSEAYLLCSVLKISSPKDGVLPQCNFFLPGFVPFFGLGLVSLGFVLKCSLTIFSWMDLRAEIVSTLVSGSNLLCLSIEVVDPTLENHKCEPFQLSSRLDSISFQLEPGSKFGVCCTLSESLNSGLFSLSN